MTGALFQQSTDFTKVILNASVLKRFEVKDNWLTKEPSVFFNFVVKLNSQYAEKQLPAIEKFSLGGPNAVRAFNVSDVSVDSGAYAGFELYFDLPFDPVRFYDNWPFEPLRPFVFFDYGYGTARSVQGDAIIKGYGLGMRVSWPGRAVANVVFATPKSASFEDGLRQAQGESRIYLDLNFTIH